MDNTQIATVIGLGIQTVGTLIQSYTTFKKTNVEKYFLLLIEENKNLSSIGNDERIQKLFYKIIDNVSNEITNEKINNWKNLTVKLATEFDDFDFSENFLKVLEDLTPFDLTVLYVIYSREFESKFFNKELIDYFEIKRVDSEKVLHSLKRLSSHYLVIEQADGASYLYDGGQHGQKFFYEKNSLGKEFMNMISN